MSGQTPSGAEREQRVCAAFCALCPLDPAVRNGALEALRAEDPWIAAEVESLLGYHTQGDAILDRPPALAAGAPADAAAPAPGPGEVIGGWTLLAPIGSGRTFVAFRARREADGRPGAVKVVRPELHSGAMAARFACADRLEWPLDPGVAEFLGAGAVPGLVFAAAELVEGEPITSRARIGALSTADRVQFLVRACRAVGAGHRRGVAHTALRPSRVRIAADGTVKVLDFGLSRLIEDRPAATPIAGGSAVLTPGRSIALAGTPCAAPEQLAPSPPVPDPRIDVYALGVIAVEVLTGRAPTTGSTDLTGLPREMTDVIKRSLSRDPADRFADALVLAEALAAASAPSARPERGWLRRRLGL